MASHGGKGVEKLDISIRTATPDDAEGLLAIYAQYVENTAVTFEYYVPSEAEFRRRIENTLKKYPYLVAVSQGEIVGYAYAGEFRKCGYKFGRWYNVAWMEKYINDHERKPQPVKTFREIAADIIE